MLHTEDMLHLMKNETHNIRNHSDDDESSNTDISSIDPSKCIRMESKEVCFCNEMIHYNNKWDNHSPGKEEPEICSSRISFAKHKYEYRIVFLCFMQLLNPPCFFCIFSILFGSFCSLARIFRVIFYLHLSWVSASRTYMNIIDL